MRISEVSERTGVSRELIHHYLRQGLLPRPETRAQYTEEQVRLLQQIKVLREEHHLPLEIIRGIFDFFGHHPGRIEALTLADSFSNRMARLTESGDALSTRTLSAEDLARAAGIPAPRVADYVAAGLVQGGGDNGEPRYSSYDARVLAVCERAVQVGVPFESLRTIASFVRVSFELESPAILPASLQGAVVDPEEAETFLADVVVRLELVTSFIQSVLHGLIARHLRDLGSLGDRRAQGLDAFVYQPSAPFVRRYGLAAAIEQAQAQLGAPGHDPEPWLRTVELMLHAGRTSEAAFYAEQARRRWPEHRRLRALHGRALLLSGQTARARELLDAADEPLCHLLGMLADLAEAATRGGMELSATTVLPAALKSALAAAEQTAPAQRLEARIFGGWLLTALPPPFRRAAQGQALLAETLAELDACPPDHLPLPGLRQRLLVNAAWLLYESAARHPRSDAGTIPDAETLRTRICRLDPGCRFAELAFLDPAGEAAGPEFSEDEP